MKKPGPTEEERKAISQAAMLEAEARCLIKMTELIGQIVGEMTAKQKLRVLIELTDFIDATFVLRADCRLPLPGGWGARIKKILKAVAEGTFK